MIGFLHRLTPRQRLGVIVLALAAGAVLGNGLGPHDEVAPAPSSGGKRAPAGAAAASAPSGVLALEKLHRAASSGDIANLFAGPSWLAKPAPPPAPAPEPAAAPVPAPAPTAPPLPFVYIGQLQEEGQSTVYYLERGPQVLVVAVGETIEGTYRVEGPQNGQLEFTYLPLRVRQGLPIGE